MDHSISMYIRHKMAMDNQMPSNMSTKVQLAKQFKEMSTALDSKIQAAHQCPEFECFLVGVEKEELHEFKRANGN